MATPDMSEAVHDVLTESQRLGFLGARPIADVVEHARSFVTALDGVVGSVADIGAGGGVPGLVIACDRPDLVLTMIDRRAKRTDFLQRMVRRLRWSDRVTVVTADVESLVDDARPAFDAVVARGFGPPDVTLSLATGLVRIGGRVVISEPPAGDRWSSEQLAELGVCRLEHADHTVAVFRRDGFT